MIETRTKAKTTEQDSQEINIYKLAGDKQWRISCSIPKFARKYRKFLDDGFEVINQATVPYYGGCEFLDIDRVTTGQTYFTEKQIKDIDERLWPFAVEVEE